MDFFAGVDGGGTKTTLICRDMAGGVLLEKTFGPFNPNSIGREACRELLEEITGTLNRTGHCRGLCIGAAGYSSPQLRALVEAAMETAGIRRWKLAGDHEIALWGALEGRPGCAVISGTGSICVGRDARGRVVRGGGWGHLIGDQGSGYALGRDLAAAVALAMDGAGEQTLMTRLLQQRMGLGTREQIIGYVYGGDKSRIAALAPLTQEAAAQGDPAADKILRRNAGALAQLAAAVARELELTGGELALMGGLLEHETPFRRRFTEEIQACLPGMRCVRPRNSPAAGAVMLAQELDGRRD